MDAETFGVPPPRFRIVKFRRLLRGCVLSWLSSAMLALGAERPNVVVILADDLGWADVGYQGADLIETPHIDALAREGLRFSQAYAMPVCSPARAALLTGLNPARIPLTIWSEGSLQGPQNRKLLQAESSHDLPLERVTLAEKLRARGYLTCLIGKWHLGDAAHFPETQGFDVNIGGTQWGAPHSFFWPYRGSGRFGNEFRFVPDLPFGKEGEYLTDRLTQEALKVIDQAGETPFFLYLAHHAPHTPMEAKAEDVAYFEQKLRPGMHHQNAVYAAMIKSLDDSVGTVRAALRERGLEQRTILLFTSDNGGYIGIDRKAGQDVPVTSNHPLRSGKGSCYEGGLRVPMCLLWPGVTQPGTHCDAPVSLMDWMPTLTAALDLEPDPAVDGVDWKPLLSDPQAPLERDALFFHYPHYYETTTPVSAVRAGRWKLLHYFEDDQVELYDLTADPGESRDLATDEPHRAAELRARLDLWRQQVGARAPQPNPNAKPSRK
ncbi:MAG: sulfatase [Verrucomicrobiales bacterium]|nr:sulfatase [Verrucomicrobiales bacterium]